MTHGDSEEVANLLDIQPAVLSRRCQVDGNVRPGLYEGLREAWAVSETNADGGWQLRAAINAYFDLWLEPVKATDKTIPGMIKDAQESLTELVVAKLENRPLREVREKARTSRSALDQLIAGLDNEFGLDAEVTPFSKRA